jgi:hypothetical protein
MGKTGMSIATIAFGVFLWAVVFGSDVKPAVYWVMGGSVLAMLIGAGMIVRSWFTGR